MSRYDTSIDPAARFTRELRDNRIWLLAFGILLVLLGGTAVLFPVLASYATNLTVGFILAASGAVDLARSARMRTRKGLLLSLLNGALMLIIGVLLILFPLPGVLTLALIVSTFFLIGGVLRILLALQLQPFDHWGWLLASGILALLLGLLILLQWPTQATWVIGVLVGIDLLFAGFTSVALALSVR